MSATLDDRQCELVVDAAIDIMLYQTETRLDDETYVDCRALLKTRLEEIGGQEVVR